MATDTTRTQDESRSERATLSLTPTEKRAVRAIAAFRDTDESNLLRTTPVADVVDEFRRLRAQQGVA